MKNFFKFIPAALTAITLASCNADDLFDKGPGAQQKGGLHLVEGGTATRSAYTSGGTMTFATGEELIISNKDRTAYDVYTVTATGKTLADLETEAPEEITVDEPGFLVGPKDNYKVSGAGQGNERLLQMRIASTYEWADLLEDEPNAVVKADLPIWGKVLEGSTPDNITAEVYPLVGVLRLNVSTIPAGTKKVVVRALKTPEELAEGRIKLAVNNDTPLSGLFQTEMDFDNGKNVLEKNDELVSSNKIEVTLPEAVGEGKVDKVLVLPLICQAYEALSIAFVDENDEFTGSQNNAVWKYQGEDVAEENILFLKKDGNRYVAAEGNDRGFWVIKNQTIAQGARLNLKQSYDLIYDGTTWKGLSEFLYPYATTANGAELNVQAPNIGRVGAVLQETPEYPDYGADQYLDLPKEFDATITLNVPKKLLDKDNRGLIIDEAEWDAEKECYVPETRTNAESEPLEEHIGQLVINPIAYTVPVGTTVFSTLDIYTPSASVELNGSYTEEDNFGGVNTVTALSTFTVTAGSEVEKLDVYNGKVIVNGTVGTLTQRGNGDIIAEGVADEAGAMVEASIEKIYNKVADNENAIALTNAKVTDVIYHSGSGDITADDCSLVRNIHNNATANIIMNTVGNVKGIENSNTAGYIELTDVDKVGRINLYGNNVKSEDEPYTIILKGGLGEYEEGASAKTTVEFIQYENNATNDNLEVNATVYSEGIVGIYDATDGEWSLNQTKAVTTPGAGKLIFKTAKWDGKVSHDYVNGIYTAAQLASLLSSIHGSTNLHVDVDLDNQPWGTDGIVAMGSPLKLRTQLSGDAWNSRIDVSDALNQQVFEFDGNEHKILNLNLSEQSVTASGFFSVLAVDKKVQISKLQIDGVKGSDEVLAHANCGGLIGAFVGYGEINRVTVKNLVVNNPTICKDYDLSMAHDMGSVIGSATVRGGNLVFAGVKGGTYSMSEKKPNKIGGQYNIGGVVGSLNGAGNVTFRSCQANITDITVGKGQQNYAQAGSIGIFAGKVAVEGIVTVGANILEDVPVLFNQDKRIELRFYKGRQSGASADIKSTTKQFYGWKDDNGLLGRVYGGTIKAFQDEYSENTTLLLEGRDYNIFKEYYTDEANEWQ